MLACRLRLIHIIFKNRANGLIIDINFWYLVVSFKGFTSLDHTGSNILLTCQKYNQDVVERNLRSSYIVIVWNLNMHNVQG